jgi:hypothetical protein
MKIVVVICAAALLRVFTPSAATADPANTLPELWGQLGACMRTAGASDGSDLTIMFALKRDGELLGKPRISHAKLPEDPASRRRVLESAASALDHCLPLSITDALGGAIAGRPLTIRLVARRRETDT